MNEGAKGRENIMEGNNTGTWRFRAVNLLRWLELKGLELDHSKLQKAHPKGLWWIAIGDQPVGPMPFRKVLEHVLEKGGTTPTVHESEAGSDSAPWRELTYSPLWLRSMPATLWTVGFWATLALLGYGTLHLLVPFKTRLVTDILYWMAVAAVLVWRGLSRRRNSSTAATDPFPDQTDPAEEETPIV